MIAYGQTLEPALVGLPPGSGPFPGILLLSEAWGLNDHVRDLSKRLAGAGFLTAAPDLVSARGSRRAVVDALRGHGSTFDKVEEAANWLASDPRCQAGGIGVVGLSMGGTIALRLATTGRFRVIAAFYGLAPRDADWARSCPIVASFGGRDRIVRGSGHRLRKALAEAGVASDIKFYERASHSFLTTSTRSWQSAVLGLRHDALAANDAWQRTVSFLGRFS